MNKTKYCTTCGRQMRYKKKIYEYNSNDGSPVYVHEWKCLVWWSGDEHDWETGMRFDDDGKLVSVGDLVSRNTGG